MSIMEDDLKIAPPYYEEYWKPDTDAVEDYQETVQDGFVIIDVLANDTDQQGDSLSIIKYGGDYWFQGTLELNEDQTITYIPAEGFNGYEYFYYTIDDGNGNTDTAYVGVYTKPNLDAVEDDAKTDINTPVTIDVLANDTDLDEGDTLSITNYGGDYWFQGELQLNEDGSINYTPAEGFSGYEYFYYTVTDQQGNTDTAFVSVYVTPNVNAVEDYTNTVENTPVTIDVLANDTDLDGDSLTISDFAGGWYFQGSLTVKDNQIVYTPAEGFIGYEYFYYTIEDSNGNYDTAYVGVNVGPSTDAIDDYTYTLVDTSVEIDVLANDLDAQGDPLQIVKFESTSYSGATITLEDNKLVYTPAEGFVGYDGFSYSIDDDHGNTDTAWVGVYVGYNEDDPGFVIDPPIYYYDVMNGPFFKGNGDDTEEMDNLSSLKTGTKKGDNLKGTSGDDLIEGKAGNDKIFGLGGNDILKGDQGKDLIKGGRGDDLINGGAGNDRLFGDNGNDTLFDDSGNNRLNGGKGDDQLIVNFDAKNILTGGQGSDQFWLMIDDLEDDNLKNVTKITDFTAGEDTIIIVGEFTFEDLKFKGSTILLDDTKLVTLPGVQANSLTSDDIIFATSLDDLV